MRVTRVSKSHRILIILLLLISIASILIRSEYVLGGGRTLLRYDPYYHYRMAEAIVEQGHRPSWDDTASWPTGQPVIYPPGYQYFLAYTFRLFGALTGGNLLTWCVFSCIIPVIIVLVLAFMVGKELSTSAGGLFCALLFGVTPYIVRRTLTGFADTDGFILIFSLVASFFWIKSLPENHKSWLYSACAGFSVFIFEFVWGGYWYLLFLLAGASLVFSILYYFLKKEFDLSKSAVLMLAFFIPHSFYSHFILEGMILTGAAVALGIVFRLKKNRLVALFAVILCLYCLYSEGFITTSLYRLEGSALQQGGVFYPDVGPFISQRQPVTSSYLLENFVTTLLLAPLGLIMLFRKKEIAHYGAFLFLALYITGGMVTLVSGARFLLIFSVPVLLSSSSALSSLWEKAARDSPGRKVAALCAVLVLMLPVYAAAERVNNESSDIEGDWWEALQWVRTHTPEDCVVISDWGNGYWIESIAKRKTIMDGGHYDLYWRLLKFGKMMQTADEEIAVKEIFGFDSPSEVQQVRTFPEGEKGVELMEKEMTAFAVPGQDAYLVIGSENALFFNFVSYFGTWDYTTGKGESTYIYPGTPVGTVFQPRWKQHLFNTQKFPVAVYEADGDFHSYIVKENQLVPTEGTIYTKEGKIYFLKRENGSEGVAWYYSDTLMAFIPADAMDTMLVRLSFFNGSGLTHFEMVADFGTVKVYKVHREPQQNPGEEVTTAQDEWSPF